MRGRLLLRWGLRLLGPTLLALLLWRAEPGAVLDDLGAIHPGWFVGAVALWVLNALLKSWRWRRLLAAQGIQLAYGRAVLWYLAGLFLGAVSPGRLGELVKVGHIRDLGYSLGRALFATVVDRLLDLLVLPFALLAGMAVYGAALGRQLETVVVALVLAAVAVAVLWRWSGLLAVPARVLMPASLREQARLTLDDFVAELRAVPLRAWLLPTGVTLGCWIVYATAVGLLAHGLGLELPPVYLAVTVWFAALAGLLPITVTGVGTRDAVFVLLLGRLGVADARAIALSTLVLGLNLAVMLLYALPYQLALSSRSEASKDASSS